VRRIAVHTSLLIEDIKKHRHGCGGYWRKVFSWCIRLGGYVFWMMKMGDENDTI
jgi:hypothetical protein